MELEIKVKVKGNILGEQSTTLSFAVEGALRNTLRKKGAENIFQGISNSKPLTEWKGEFLFWPRTPDGQ